MLPIEQLLRELTPQAKTTHWCCCYLLTRAARLVDFIANYFDFTVSNTISGGTPKRTERMLVPIPVVTKR